MDEKTILEGLKNREEPVLWYLQQTYTAYLCQVARRIIGAVMTEEDIEEVVGDAFYQLWSHAGELELKKGSLKAYLTAIVRNGAKNKLRKCRLMEEPLQELDYLEVPGPEETAMKRETSEAVGAALQKLNALDREIMIRFYYLYQTTAEIAELTGQKENTVKSRLRRGRKKLEQILRKGGYGR